MRDGRSGAATAALSLLLVQHTGAYRGRAAYRAACAVSSRSSCVCSIAGADDGPGPDDPDAERLEVGRRRMEEIFQQDAESAGSADALSATERLLQQLFPSSQFVGGGSLPTKFIFVDELTCIGCTHCKYVAPKTFMLEDDFGRARVYKQGGDPSDKIDEAIECCPVECIHQVSHTELVRLEKYREEKGDQLQGKYWKSRLVGSELGIPKVPNWWEPLLDSSQPAWAGLISGPDSMSALGFLGPAPTEETVETDMWGSPIQKDAPEPPGAPQAAAPPSEAQLGSIAAGDLDVCDLVDCTDAPTADLAAQLEAMLALEATGICDVVSCDDVLRDRRQSGQATPDGSDGDGAAPDVEEEDDAAAPDA